MEFWVEWICYWELDWAWTEVESLCWMVPRCLRFS